ncbi:hypothetical protein V6P99_24110 [Streptomyces virginiae]|uniref:hypothetical protein n=1 Tax=Streptomyces virginiae TaxID=1961 RepID=UPI0030D0F971
MSEEIAENGLAAAIESELEVCRRPLRDFSVNHDDENGFARVPRRGIRHPVEPRQMPVPLVISMTLSLLIGSRNLGRAEKLDWEYPFRYRGVECSISSEKFGIRIYVDRAGSVSPSEIAAKISAAARMMEKNLLSLMARKSMTAGEITVPNLYHKLRGMYEHFRDMAHEAYSGNIESKATAAEGDFAGELTNQISGFMTARREGLYATVAMVNSYFSLLEHTLVLSLPSAGFDPGREPVSSFIGSKLFDKYDTVFSAHRTSEVQRVRGKLKDIAEVWRNPYSHGGFDKMHKAIGFHVAGLGVIPIGLSSVSDSPEFSLFPAREQGFDGLCVTFDEIDEFLSRGPLWASLEWIKSGLDVPFDARSLSEFHEAEEAGPEEFSNYISRTAHFVEQGWNMDW